MVFKSSTSSLPRLSSSLPRVDVDSVRRTVRRPVGHRAWLTLLWQTGTLPFWLASDLPKPTLPQKTERFADGGAAGNHVVKEINRIRRRIWFQRSLAILARALVLVLLVSVLWQAWELMGGSGPNADAMAVVALVVGIPALLFAAFSRPSYQQVGRMLDRSFELQERVTTALAHIGQDVPSPGATPGMIYRQVADAANAITVNRRDPAFGFRLPVRELILAIILGLTLASLFLLRGPDGAIAPVQSNIVPAFVSAAEQYVQAEEMLPATEQSVANAATASEIEDWLTESNDARNDLQALSEALDDHALTHQVSNLIRQGDYAAAAQALRDVAGDAGQLSDEERQSLASDLKAAAGQMSDGSQLGDASNEAAQSLNEGGPRAEAGIESLGDAVEQTGEKVGSPGSTDQAIQQSSQPSQSGSDQSGSQPESGSSNSESSLFGSSSEGESGSSGSPSDGQQDSSDSGSTGADATGGVGQEEQPAEGGESTSGDAQSGSAQQSGAAQAPSEDVTGGASEASTQQGGSSEQTAAEETSNSPSSTGTGAGGQSEELGPNNQETGSSGSSANQTGEATEDPSAPNVSEADTATETTSEGTSDPRQAISLSRDGAGEQIQLPGSSGTSSVGTGAGVTISSGTSTQGEVAEAGPDSNHVPAEYRSVVEAYFARQEDR